MPAEVSLASKIADLNSALDGCQIPHAFGGALALAYYAEPRATHDIDVNVFVDPSEVDQLRKALERVTGKKARIDVAEVERDGQTRFWWETTPVDLFFNYDPIHDAMREDARAVPFGDVTILILSPEHLIVCKAVFDRPKDWVDIDAIVVAKTVLRQKACLGWLERIVGVDDPRFVKLANLLRPALQVD